MTAADLAAFKAKTLKEKTDGFLDLKWVNQMYTYVRVMQNLNPQEPPEDKKDMTLVKADMVKKNRQGEPILTIPQLMARARKNGARWEPLLTKMVEIAGQVENYARTSKLTINDLAKNSNVELTKKNIQQLTTEAFALVKERFNKRIKNLHTKALEFKNKAEALRQEVLSYQGDIILDRDESEDIKNKYQAWLDKEDVEVQAYEKALGLGCELRLLPSVKDVGGIPAAGKNVIIVAAVNKVLHFRIFDEGGKKVVEADEKQLTGQARPIEDLRKKLASLWAPRVLTGSQKGEVIEAVESIVGYTLTVKPGDTDRLINKMRADIQEYTDKHAGLSAGAVGAAAFGWMVLPPLGFIGGFAAMTTMAALADQFRKWKEQWQGKLKRVERYNTVKIFFDTQRIMLQNMIKVCEDAVKALGEVAGYWSLIANSLGQLIGPAGALHQLPGDPDNPWVEPIDEFAQLDALDVYDLIMKRCEVFVQFAFVKDVHEIEVKIAA